MAEYDFRTLSSFDFELLVRDVLQAETGVLFENFKPGKDTGIDLRHSASPDRQIIVQAKHYADSGYAKLLRDLRDKELPKVVRLAPRDYVLATSVPFSPPQMDEIAALLRPACSGTVTVYGQQGINNLLARHPAVEQNHYKLWLSSRAVLDRVLHSEVFNQTEYDREAIEHRMRLYVGHGGFDEARRILEHGHVCIISGPPGIGKTTLAEMLLVSYLDQGYLARRISGDIQEAVRADDPDRNARIVYYYDDFLGQTSLTEKMGKNEDAALLRFMEAVERRPNRRLILTTREYLLRHARATYERLHRATEIDVYKYVLDLARYTRANKAHILFNHLYFSALPLPYREQLLAGERYLEIIDHPNYSPRIIEWMTKSGHVRGRAPERYAADFLAALANPAHIWEHAFDHQVGEDARAALYVLSSLSLRGECGLPEFERAFGAFVAGPPRAGGETPSVTTGTALGLHDRFRKALRELDGTFVAVRRHDRWGAEPLHLVTFQNPSIRDFLAFRIAEDGVVSTHLLTTAPFFEQCEALAKLALDRPGSPLQAVTSGAAFVAALGRTRDESVGSFSRSQAPGHAEPAVNHHRPSEEQRSLRLLQLTAHVAGAEVTPLLEDCAARLQARLEGNSAWADDAVLVLEGLTGRLWGNPPGGLLAVAGAVIVSDTAELCGIAVFEAAATFLETYPGVLSKEDEDAVRENFRDYCTGSIQGELRSGNEPEDYRSMIERVEGLQDRLGVDVSDAIAALAQDAAELEYRQDEEADRAREEGRSRRSGAGAEQMSDASIRAMFDALRE